MQSKKINPLNDRVLIKPLSDETYNHGNIIIPDAGKERPEVGEVIAVGPGRLSEFGIEITPNVTVGDLVLIPKIGTLRFPFEGEEYYITNFKEILAKIN